MRGRDHLSAAANRGLGLETSRQLLAEGVTVFMAGRDARSIEAAAKSLAGAGEAHPLVLDITRPEQVEAAREQIGEQYGRLDILINNAGVIVEGGFMQNNAATVSVEQLRQTFEVNLFATVALTQVLLPLLEAAPAGRIVNVSSILGSLAIHSSPDSPLAGLAPLAYNASKAALNMFTVGLAAALKDSPIKVNSAHPGWVKTEVGGEEAPMEVAEGSKTAVALALLDAEGPSGRFIHLGDELPW